ncbi:MULTISPECIES: hypothetical protein [unclassified Sphingopyxis]|uniref:hypothetical protein n=1 Tax=unclassified Sphingopyxis TaxID=2614943 RepID=UPI000736A793|nr:MULTISPECIES: hypothetical protein [unclassified Sphingopyxis]KTE30044.1 hypothetical protein ATE62_20675 [Sphingopyxis sp. HIX]KTE84773.1 hypothetical protein ATE72_06955 [Sphingopyxis sp. HXXIV]
MENLDNPIPNPADIPAPGSYHWTPALQRSFLESLAATGSVISAAAMVCMSPSAAYQFKQRPEGAAFRIGWAAAVLIARDRLADQLLERAIWGYEETSEVDPDDHRRFTRRRRHDGRLGLAMLARLDRMVETRAKAGEAMLAQIVAGDWSAFLALFDLDFPQGEEDDAPSGLGAALACWLAGRDNRANPLASLWQNTPIANEVAQFSADPDIAPPPPATPEEEAEAMTVWHDEERNELRTNFPPADDFIGDEEGQFGDRDYERTLDADETAAYEDAYNEELAPLRAAGEAARRAFFGFPEPANDREAGEEQGSRKDAKTQKG